MTKLPKPIEGSIIFEDDYLYVCLANFPITAGHCVVVWKEDITDIHLLSRIDYDHLMEIVDQTRNALINAFEVDKVYLMYMDEVMHVHWHLIPRYDEEGFNILKHTPEKLSDVSIADVIKKYWQSLK
jgi:diadenosine tetraphosphate (Ap4A) HIT family hydrolase